MADIALKLGVNPPSSDVETTLKLIVLFYGA